MQPGYRAFPIADFAEHRPPPRELTAGWACRIHTFVTEDGREQWRTDNSEWDFDLRRWLEDRRLFWCPPHSGNSALSTDPTEMCPFLDLPGLRTRVVVYGEQSWKGASQTALPCSAKVTHLGPRTVAGVGVKRPFTDWACALRLIGCCA